jgi:CRISPR-associated protein Cmr6
MSTPNLGWLYYRDLYNDQRQETIEIDGKPQMAKFSFDFLKKEKERKPSKEQDAVLKMRSQQFFNKKLSVFKAESFFDYQTQMSSFELETFELTTTYPGLLCGVGYNHGISSESDFKVGFYFDHTTGLPIIPGSSVKGVLRSAFPGYIRKDEDKLSKEEKEEFSKRYDFFRWMIEEVNRKENTGIARFSNKEIDVLEAFIFEGQDEKGEQISYYKRDRFFDAYPVKSLEKDGYFLKNDYITPHINREKPEMSPFTSPNPIQFLKVLPQVKFQFQFKLLEGGGMKPEQKEALFKEILCFMGVGAKTNVGYGQFAEGFEDAPESKAEVLRRSEPMHYKGSLKSFSKPIEALVVDQNTRKVKMIINEEPIEKMVTGKNALTNGTLVLVRLNLEGKPERIRDVNYMGEVRK